MAELRSRNKICDTRTRQVGALGKEEPREGFTSLLTWLHVPRSTAGKFAHTAATDLGGEAPAREGARVATQRQVGGDMLASRV